MIRLRVTKIDEFQFLTCLKHGLWGSKSARFKDWRIGDQLVLLAENTVAGLASVAGPPFHAETTVWDNGLFPHRIPISFRHTTLVGNRPRVLGEVRDVLSIGFPVGGGWGLGILNQRLMDPTAAQKLVSIIGNVSNDLTQMRQELEVLLAAAKLKRDARTKRSKETEQSPRPATSRRAKRIAEQPVVTTTAALVEETEVLTNEPEESVHLTAQALLIDLGRTVGCNVWVASNDKTKLLGGKPIGIDCLSTLPSMGLSAEAAKAIGLIDVIWLKKNAPVAAFEVEATTSVHSGLLRMSDLVELVPALKMDLYIVAPRDRQPKVLRELGRPTFRRIGLSDICRFVAIDDLDALLKKLSGLKGFVQPEIIESIAIALPEQVESALA